MPKRSPILAASLLAFLLMMCCMAQADELKGISQLAEQGQAAQALDKVNAYVAAHPADIQGQFLKGVILAGQGKSADAIKIFTDLSSKHPELPEPYNNLAVLYAEQGQYDKARRALELAIKTHPSYATAHENLSDVYARMATDAYDKALQIDKTNARTQTKLTMVKELFAGQVRPPLQVAAAKVDAQPPKVVQVMPPPATEAVAKPVVAPGAAKPAPPVAVSPEPPKPMPPADPSKEAKSKPEVAEISDQVDQKVEVDEVVKGWAKAWSAKNVDGYLAYYGAGFKVPGGESRSVWEKSRRERITAPASIKVELSGIKIKMEGDGRATASFRQSYRAGDISKRTSKLLILKKGGNKWYIEQELTDR